MSDCELLNLVSEIVFQEAPWIFYFFYVPNVCGLYRTRTYDLYHVKVAL
jgi:hypothetical protein